MELAINELTTYRWSFEQDVWGYVEAGIPALGVWRRKLSDFGEESGIRLLLQSHLAVSSLLWAGGFTGSDGRSYEESIEDAAEAVRLAAAMDAGCLIVYTGGRGLHTSKHARRLALAAIRELVPLAHSLDVTLALEPMHPGCADEWTFLTDLDDAVEFVDELDSSHVKLVFDTYHMAQECAIADRLPELVSRIALVQVGDARHPPVGGEQNRCPLGAGSVPLTEIITALRRSGYRGYLELELRGEDMERLDYHELIRQSRETIEQIGTLA